MTETAQQIVLDLVKAELNQFRPAQIEKVLQLLEEGNTVPFIARYRKAVTGGLDDTQLRKLEERLSYLRELEARRLVPPGRVLGTSGCARRRPGPGG